MLVGSGTTATGSVTVKGSALAAGVNTITATYAGNNGFAASSGAVTPTDGSAVASNVVVTATKSTSPQPGFPVKLQLEEMAGGATTLTGFTINGTDFSSVIAAFFGSTQMQRMPARFQHGDSVVAAAGDSGIRNDRRRCLREAMVANGFARD